MGGAAVVVVSGGDGGATWWSGRRELLACLAHLLLGRLQGLAAAVGDDQPPGEQAKTGQTNEPAQPAPPRPACCLAALLGASPEHHVHLPPPASDPADWVALLFPLFGKRETNRGPMA